MTTDNRTNEPTEVQVEAAVKEYTWNGSMRAALVAAQEAAPQAETDRVMEIAQELAKMHTFTLADGEAIARAALSLAAPVLPSSTVDVGALAEVIEGAEAKFVNVSQKKPLLVHFAMARAVIEWLSGGEKSK